MRKALSFLADYLCVSTALTLAAGAALGVPVTAILVPVLRW